MRKARTVKEVLKAAKYILTNYGWSQGYHVRDQIGNPAYINDILTGHSKLGSCCVSGAIQLVEVDGNAYDLKQNALMALTDKINYNVVLWNDDTYRTKKQVLRLLSDVIDDK